MNDLWTVEERWVRTLDENNMVGEDYRMRAHQNHELLME